MSQHRQAAPAPFLDGFGTSQSPAANPDGFSIQRAEGMNGPIEPEHRVSQSGWKRFFPQKVCTSDPSAAKSGVGGTPALVRSCHPSRLAVLFPKRFRVKFANRASSEGDFPAGCD